jgi:hypothetical protein
MYSSKFDASIDELMLSLLNKKFYDSKKKVFGKENTSDDDA